jgi:hypothetical protein
MRERSCYIHIVLFEAKIGKKKKLWMLKQETNYKVDAIVALNLNIVFFFLWFEDEFFLKEGEWYDSCQGWIITLVFGLMFHNVQFYANMDNSQFNY